MYIEKETLELKKNEEYWELFVNGEKLATFYDSKGRFPSQLGVKLIEILQKEE